MHYGSIMGPSMARAPTPRTRASWATPGSSSPSRRRRSAGPASTRGLELETEVHLALAAGLRRPRRPGLPDVRRARAARRRGVRRRHRGRRPAPRPLHLRRAHPGLQRRQPSPRAGGPLRARLQRRPHRGAGRGPALRRRHGVPRRRRGRARARPVARPDLAPRTSDPTACRSPPLRKKEPDHVHVPSPSLDGPRRRCARLHPGDDRLRGQAARQEQPRPRPTYTVLTPKPTSAAGDVVWATYRETQTLDPIQAFDYPENTVDPLLCDSLLRQAPDQTLGPGIATYTSPSATQYDFTLNSKATFWDGSPVTAQDAVFSLDRAKDPKAGGYYAAVFNRVASIEATGTHTFTIKLKQPDQWLLGELSATPGEVVQKKYVESKGKAFGTVSGGTMCSGPFKLDSWKTGQGVKMVPNPNYWDTSLPKPQGQEPDRDRHAGRRDADRGTEQRRDRRLLRHRHQHPGPDGEELVAERLPGSAVRHCVHGGQRHQGPAGQRRRSPGAVGGHRPPGHHRHRLPGSRQHPARGGRQRHLGLREEHVPERLRRVAGDDPEPVQGQVRRQGGRHRRPDDHHRYVVRHPDRADRDPRGPAGSAGDRPQGEAEERQPVELHQLLHRPEVLRLGRHVLDPELRRLRRPGRPLQQLRDAGRFAELQRLRQPPGHPGHERRARRGRSHEAGAGRDRGPEDHHRAAGLDPAGRAEHGAGDEQEGDRAARRPSPSCSAHGPATSAAAEGRPVEESACSRSS